MKVKRASHLRDLVGRRCEGGRAVPAEVLSIYLNGGNSGHRGIMLMTAAMVVMNVDRSKGYVGECGQKHRVL